MILTTTLMLALAGCSGDDGGGLDDGGSDGTDGGTGDGDDDDGTGDDGDDMNETEEFEPQHLNGTISQGLFDCSAPVADTPADMAATETLPEGAGGRSYTLTTTATNPAEEGPVNSCVSFDGGATWLTASSGSIPEDATEVRIGVDGGYQVDYSFFIE